MFDEVLAAFRMGPGEEDWRHARLVYARQGGRRRLSAQRVRRPARDYGAADADRRLSAFRHLDNGHPTPIAAAIAALTIYGEPGFYDHIRSVGAKLFAGMNKLFAKYDVPGRVEGLGTAVRYLLR